MRKPEEQEGTIFQPTLNEWKSLIPTLRDSLDKFYTLSESVKNDTQFAKTYEINRSQFSRVVNGIDRPSPRIMKIIKNTLPKFYETVLETYGSTGSVEEMVILYKSLLENDKALAKDLQDAVSELLEKFNDRNREKIFHILLRTINR